MIIYGTKGEKLAQEAIADSCQNCGSQNSIYMFVFQKYGHLFWIPFFPMSKTGISQCNQCRQVLKLENMPPSLTSAYHTLKAKTRTPIWMFSGLAIVVVLIILGAINDRNNNERNAKVILTPQSGDILEIRTMANQYTLFKIEYVFGDSVFIRPNIYETNKSTGIDKIKDKGDNAYSQEIYGFSKAELKKKFDNGEILNIDRK